MTLSALIETDINSTASNLRQVGMIDEAVFLEDARDWVANSALRIAVIGEYNVGKSTLINALLGEELLEAGLRPMSAEVTCLQKGKEDEVIEVPETGAARRHSLSELERLGTLENGSFRQLGIARLDVTLASFALPENIILIDTPGINDGPQQSKRAERAAILSDLVLLIVNARQVATKDERIIVEKLRGQQKKVIVVVNHLNLLQSEKERDAVRALLLAWLGENNAILTCANQKAFLEINAIGALRKALALNHDSPEADDFNLLRRELETIAQHALNSEGLGARKRYRSVDSELSHIETRIAQQIAPFVEAQRLQDEARQTLANQARTSLRRIRQIEGAFWYEVSAKADMKLDEELSTLLKWVAGRIFWMRRAAAGRLKFQITSACKALSDLGRESLSPYLLGTNFEVQSLAIKPPARQAFKPSTLPIFKLRRATLTHRDVFPMAVAPQARAA